MSGIVSIGRSLLIRQVLLAGLVTALGAYAYISISAVADLARTIATMPRGADVGAPMLQAAAESAASHVGLATLVAALLMTVVAIPVIHFTIGRPLKAMASEMERVASGDFSGLIDGEDRNDELGTMARALQRLRGEAVRTAEEHETAGLATDSHDQRSRAITERVETFSRDLVGQVRKLGTMTDRLAKAADLMIVAARHASDGSDQATNASMHAATDVSSVATASEQLLDSIEEISRQVVQSTNVVKAAVERAVDSNAGMGRLSSAAQKVGDVVSLISRIAAQTNLLALNATIEAARAGEAGRGFAVVAQEVKTLATQTAKATQDISGQIAEMQEATDLSVEAIDKIQRQIGEVEHISSIIAAAVHEQGAATQEIARNVRSAAAGTSTMSSHIENVVRSVGDTSSNAASVSTLARELDALASGMTEMVEAFSRSLMAA